jgi:hypothetical protein
VLFLPSWQHRYGGLFRSSRNAAKADVGAYTAQIHFPEATYVFLSQLRWPLKTNWNSAFHTCLINVRQQDFMRQAASRSPIVFVAGPALGHMSRLYAIARSLRKLTDRPTVFLTPAHARYADTVLAGEFDLNRIPVPEADRKRPAEAFAKGLENAHRFSRDMAGVDGADECARQIKELA